jgi:putative tryptophan/tyrosine transport system substrate-binding protein
MRRREFIVGLGSAATWPVPARPQQSALPVVGLLIGEALDSASPRLSGFRKGLCEIGYVEGQNVLIEYHSVEGQFDRIPAMVADLVRRRVAVIVTPAIAAATLAAKSATATIPIVFGVAGDPVRLGLVASLARPGGNLTGMASVSTESPQRGGSCQST